MPFAVAPLPDRGRQWHGDGRAVEDQHHSRPASPRQHPRQKLAGEVTIEWWHISTLDPGKTLWQNLANQYMAAHPNVKINITILENEAFKTKLTSVMQGGTPPDIFQSWGGGVMNDQITAGMLQDITPALDANSGAWRATFAPGALAVYAENGKNYGVPWDMGMVGWWYNKDLFTKAGITSVPATWDDLLTDVKTLKAAGITPISLGEKDTWTGMHMWSYLATRICGQAKLPGCPNRTGGSFDDPCFVQAGTDLKQLIDLQPFEAGFLGMSHDQMQGTFGNGKAAMELSGQWAPGSEAGQAADKKGVANLGLFNFPAVAGGAGDVTDVMGGGNGFAIGKNAPPEAIDFVKFLSSVDNATPVDTTASTSRRWCGTNSAITDPNLRRPCWRAATRRPSCSSTWTRQPTLRWARPLTKRPSRCSLAPARPSRRARRSRTPRRPTTDRLLAPSILDPH